MELLFLGTCACDYSPRLSGDLRDRFDKDARRSSAVLLNGHILIDCGDHVRDALRIAGVEESRVTDIVVTHLHHDHFRADHVIAMAEKHKGLRLFVRWDAVLPPLPGVTVVRMEKMTPYDLGGGLFVTGLLANHNEDAFPQHLYFEGEGKRFLYGCDGAWLLHETYQWLFDKRLTLFVADATCGDYAGDLRMAMHNSIPMLRLMVPSMKTVGILTDDTVVCLSHLAPSLHEPHDETVKIASKEGWIVAHDGMTLHI